jgi:SAM-dependent methyltransferase
MSEDSIYATPKLVTNIDECHFYHTVDIPGHGVVEGLFDLREGAREYLGNVDFEGKRVLELGTASGFLCFHMESRGAEVVAFDLSEDDLWDIVPLYNCDYEGRVAERREVARSLNNAFWFSHRAFNSNARLATGTVYTIPREIGMVDISTVGSILLHVRDPFLALQNALRLTRETVIITDGFKSLPNRILDKLRLPFQLSSLPRSPRMEFVPTPRAPKYADTWWNFSPEIIKRMIAVLGFEEVAVNSHWQRYKGRRIRLSTVVGHRTRDHYAY